MDSNITAAIITLVGNFLLTELGKLLHSKKQVNDTEFLELNSEVISNLEILETAKMEFENNKNNQILRDAVLKISIEKLSSKDFSSLTKNYKKQDKMDFCNAFNRAIANTKNLKRDFQKTDYWNNKNQASKRVSLLIEKFEILKTYLENI